MKKISGSKPSKQQAYIRMQINDRVFDERGESSEVLAHFREWLDHEITESITVLVSGTAVQRKSKVPE